jgi:hypothetical protein
VEAVFFVRNEVPGNPAAPDPVGEWRDLVSGPVPVDTRLSVRFDRYLRPDQARRQSVCLVSGLTPVTRLVDCKNGDFLSPSYDPVERRVTYVPAQPLDPDTTYSFSVFSAVEGGFGFEAFDGAALELTPAQSADRTVLVLQFKTDGDPSVHAGRLEEEKLVTRCSGLKALEERCGNICHASTSASPMGIVLERPKMSETAFGVVAHETQLGGGADRVAANPPRLGVAMPRIDPSSAGNSYVLYKVLASDAADAWEVQTAGSGPKTRAPGEGDRLKLSLVVGAAMPPAQPMPDPFGPEDARHVSAWINAGAPIKECAGL